MHGVINMRTKDRFRRLLKDLRYFERRLDELHLNNLSVDCNKLLELLEHETELIKRLLDERRHIQWRNKKKQLKSLNPQMKR